MKTILTAMLLALSVTAAAAQATFYGPGGDYVGQATRHRNTTTFYDSRGNFVGSSLTTGRSTSFFGRDGAFEGTLTRTGDTTNFYDRAGRYQGSVTHTMHSRVRRRLIPSSRLSFAIMSLLPNARYWVNHRHDRSKKGFIPVA
jgi:hypothetical protein